MKEIVRFKKDSEYIIFHKYGEDDYSVWFTEDPNDETEGFSLRGTKNDVIKECKEVLTAEELSKIIF